MTARAEAKKTELVGEPPQPTVTVTEEEALKVKAASGEKPKAVATAPIPKGAEREILPIKPNQFGLATHRYRQHDAVAPTGMTIKDVQDPKFWSHVANQLHMFSEVRVLAEDGAWVAYVIVSFKHANSVKVTVLNYVDIESISYDTAGIREQYVCKQKGVLKWCIEDTDTGENVFKYIPTQAEALKQRDEYIATLSR